MVLPERMSPFHSPPEPPDEASPLPLLSTRFSGKSLSSSTTDLQPARMPEPTPVRLSSAEDGFRSGVSAGLLGESAKVARGEPRLLEEIPSEPPSAGGMESSATALTGPKAAAGESCKQHLGSLPTAYCSTTYASEFLQTTSFWCCSCRWVISSPMLSELESFAQALSDRGYRTRTARLHLRAAEHFLYWTHRQTMSVNEQSLVGFERHLSRCHCPHYGHRDQLSVVRGARLFLAYLREARIIIKKSIKPPVHDPALLLAFCQWMRQQRGICDVTLRSYRIYIRELLQRLEEEPSRFDARRLRAFVIVDGRSCGWGTAKNCATVVRMFLRFLIADGQCAVGLDAAIPTVAHWRLASLPRYLPPKDVERLIASCDRASAVGRRDRAILLLLARLGLRAGDIVYLRLNDIDWKDTSIQVCGKGRRTTRLPLSQEVGQAIVAYLKKGRPRTNADTLFIRCRAPYCAFASHNAVTRIVDKAFRRTGVMRPSRLPCCGKAHRSKTLPPSCGTVLWKPRRSIMCRQ